ncbi:TetR/AcrR family transcriptional regulator [Tepidibacter hydrothermalis]|uniref:TetR/AcrR family transcriptional regulator n=1 Tax=Tepidibacter hydrothermalis TaxID=3036126 RepID=A0ABY8EI19_9FIRM|nr:TetR/AcrR family transcriptional regulator [Tepidibacter hydrothermalis]WFD10438.1 TetR/AcrR family transcriptional regulator [Tepidibacter hydrothermalis]
MMKDLNDKKQQVFETALEMILENGVQSASMGKISKASGVAVGTIYHYFSSKEELITELYRMNKLNFISSFQQIERGKTPRETFQLCMKAYIKYGMEYPKEFEFINRFYKSPLIDENVTNEIEELMFKQNPLISEFFSNNDILKDVKTELIFMFISGALTHTVRECLNGQISMNDEDWDNFIDMLWDGVSK